MEEFCSRRRHLVFKLAESIGLMKDQMRATKDYGDSPGWEMPNPSTMNEESIDEFCARPQGLGSLRNRDREIGLRPRIVGIWTGMVEWVLCLSNTDSKEVTNV